MNHRSEVPISRLNHNEAPLVWPAHHERWPNPVSTLDHLARWRRTTFRVPGFTQGILLATFSSRLYVAGHEVDWCRNALKVTDELVSAPKHKAGGGIRLKFSWYAPVRRIRLGYKANENFLKKFSSKPRMLLSVNWILSSLGNSMPTLASSLSSQNPCKTIFDLIDAGDLAHGGRDKVGDRNSEMENDRHGKKSYQRPKCTRMSISELAQLIRRKTLGHGMQLEGGALFLPDEVQLLLVLGYVGDINFIRRAVRSPARELGPFATIKGVGWVEMQLVDAERADLPGNFLLLDLRNRHHAEYGFLKSIGHKIDRNERVPRVILATSSKQILDWNGVDPQRCWQLPSCPTPEGLSTALHSFLHLCSILANGPAQETSASDPARDHALSGTTGKD
jgi:hypothetical protein